jgi:tetratricopeptide (TPR) repeat protein
MIVVAIPNTDRARDFTPIHSLVNALGRVDSELVTSGGGDNFLRFLGEELIPYIDKNYRTQPYRILEGHSLGGMFATYVLEAAPALFNSFVIISPSFYGGNFAVLGNVGKFLSDHPDLRKSVFVTIGNEPLLRKSVDSLVHQLKDHAPKSLHWDFKDYRNEDHMSVPLLSMYDGLRYVYSKWWIDLYDSTKVPTFDALRAHYKSISGDLGCEILPTEDVVNMFGYVLLHDRGKVDDAILVFRENVKNYPASFNVYDSIGEGYMVKGDKDLAIFNYEKSIQLNPDNNNGKRMLAKLREVKK